MHLSTYGQDEQNIALGARYTLDPAPNYALCTDPEDSIQLTDGKRTYTHAEPRIWAHKGTVGWNTLGTIPVITIDLGSVQKIAGVSYCTGAGAGGVYWPRAVFVLVSNDQQTWKVAGDLVQLDPNAKIHSNSAAHGTPSIHRYFSDQIKASGRYIALAIQPQPAKANYVFCDEIEIFAGSNKEEHYEAELPEHGLDGIRSFMEQMLFKSLFQERLTMDTAVITNVISESSLPEQLRTEFLNKLQNVKTAIQTAAVPNTDTFTTVFPFNSLHKEIYAMYGAFLHARGLPPLVVTKQYRYHPIKQFFDPESASNGLKEIHLEQMQNEVRHDAFLLTKRTK